MVVSAARVVLSGWSGFGGSSLLGSSGLGSVLLPRKQTYHDNDNRQRQRRSDVKISKLNMPFPELEAQAAQALLTAVVAAGNLPGMGPGAKPTVMAPKGQVRSLVDGHLRTIGNSSTAAALKAEMLARGLKVGAGANKATVLAGLLRTDGGNFTQEDWNETPFDNTHIRIYWQ